MKKKTLIAFTLILFIITNLVAQDFKVDINKLTEETQQVSQSNDRMRLVWWIPIEFWQTIFEQDETLTKLDADKMLIILEKYTMLAIIDGNIAADGNISYISKGNTFNNLKIIDKNNIDYAPLLEDEIDADAQNLITIMKPILANMLGKLGENMHFYLFQKRNNPLEQIANPKKKGKFEVKIDKESFIWNLPLGSLLKPKKCPEDGILHDGSWSYCPYHGKKLIEN